MGNHWGSGREKEPAGGCAMAVRVLAAGAVVATSLFAVGFPGSSPVELRPAASPAGAGHVGLPGLAGPFLTDSRALVPFNRTLVRTIAKGGSAPLIVAATGLTRPPEGFLMAPLEFLTSSSPFGYRVSPITGAGGDFHLGQDFAAGCGTRVYAADAGVVRAAGWHPWGGGNRVELDHGNGLITTYNHLEAVAVRTGDSVQVGQVIARVGTTGWSTGCHLHFETILNGKHTSPLNWTLLRIRQLDELEDIAMVSYEAKPGDVGAQRWAIPVAEDNSHTVLGGEEELSEPPPVEGSVTTSETPDEAPTEEPSSDATSTGSASPDPTATEPATETATSTASPSPTPSTPRATRTPTGTSSATPTTTTMSPTPAGTSPAPTTSASPSPTPTVSWSWPLRPTSRLTPTPAPTVEPTATTSSESSAETAAPSPSSSTTATTTATPTDTATWSESAGP
ncbi:peptidoglycan DD-metalloendopeptidase family protein [Pseudarthrobacter sp. RMG13]|uniref:Peptidoglycan DD-metalloendopeptidase family protein n=1 Tax=Pseudarthrobacter humi TaxID=2952523 RepID=A0ABT1LR94_9MICC|nr:peptidoglycan DD-metalloendopeptidase family protein [Pseudarthrobacter humi]MCP9000985.1 peptidoglycan DD-metalloendopeptidase family protein [Pseudarthrobacter humi]